MIALNLGQFSSIVNQTPKLERREEERMNTPVTDGKDVSVSPNDKNKESHDELVEEMMMLYQNLRNVRHTVNNHVAVIMAMAEWSQRYPEQSEKLVRMSLEKCPQIVMALRGFSELFDVVLKKHRPGA